jgi:hypothetical protein
MAANELIYIALLAVSSLILAIFLSKKVGFFRSFKGFLSLAAASASCIVLHNLVFALVHIEVPVFFILVFLCAGTALFLFLFWAVQKIRE